MIKSLIELFHRDLDVLGNEISMYSTDEQLWVIPEGVLNSGGTLCLHIVGNLQHFIGAVLGETGYVRDREAEFADRGIPVEEIATRIATTRDVIESVLRGLSDDDLGKKYPLDVFGYPMTTGYFLIHLYGHFSYHLGQINYHRRMTNGSE